MNKKVPSRFAAGVFCAFVSVGEASAAEYANDFSVRTGEMRRMNGWLAMPYACGNVAYNYDETLFWPALPYNDSSKVQDGWVKVRRNQGGASADVEVVGSDNPYLRFTTTGKVTETSVMHAIGNEFSNGTVRICCDLRSSGDWTSQGGGYVRVMPVVKSALNPNSWLSDVRMLSNWGLQAEGWYTYGFLLSGDAWNNAIANKLPNGVKYTWGHWYRFVTDLDLDAGRISCTVYDQGTDIPAFDGSNGTQMATLAPTRLYRLMSNEWGPVVGVAVRTREYGGSDPIVDSSLPAMDNLAVAWKAPGASQFARCYENDFAERRCRKLTADAKTHSYVRGAEIGGLTFSSYPAPVPKANSGVTPILRNSTGTSVSQPKGVDGWRRMNADGKGDLHLVGGGTDDAGGTMLRASKGWNFVIGANTFGQKVTSGKVRFSGDIRVPSSWTWLADAGFLFGGDSFYSAGKNEVWTAPACSFGFSGSTSPQTLQPCASGATETTSASAIDGWTTWYRFVVTADIDAKTYDLVLYRGTGDSPNYDWTPAVADRVWSLQAQPFKDTFADDGLSSFGVYSYGHNAVNNPDTNVYFDNLRVWRDVGTAQEKEIYRNLFSERTVWPDADSG